MEIGRNPRSTYAQLYAMKKQIIEKYIRKEIKGKEASDILCIHPKSFSRLVSRYKRYGEDVLIPRKPGPKKYTPDNKTPDWIEQHVCELGEKNMHLGPCSTFSGDGRSILSTNTPNNYLENIEEE